MPQDAITNGSRKSNALFKFTGYAVIVGYLGSYFFLFILGRYEPAAFGSNGIKWFMWVPWGFPDFAASKGMTWQWAFVPLWLLDSRTWHASDKSHDPGYRRKQWDASATPPGWRLVVNPE